MQENKELTPEEKILEAALEVVYEYTISGTRMHLIAAKAGVAQANLHYHFKTKKDLLIALLHYIQKDFTKKRAAVMAQQPDTLPGQLYGFFEQKRRLITEDPALDLIQIDYWSQGQVDKEINRCFQQSYAVWRSHIIDTVLLYDPAANIENLRMVAGIMVSMMMGASIQYLADPGVFDLEQYFETCQTMVLQYIDKHL